jgi:ferritin-like metal-binding protein YciE
MALKNETIAGYDKKSVWAQIFGRDRADELLKIMLDEEEATYQRLMELARRVRPPAVHRLMELARRVRPPAVHYAVA